MTVRYDRAPSAGARARLGPGGPLAPLLAPRRVAGLRVDAHLRERDGVTLYVGGAGVLSARVGADAVELRAHRTYARQAAGAAAFGRGRDQGDYVVARWSTGEAALWPAIEAYLEGLTVSATWAGREGAVQAAWAEVAGPWVPFDREAVLGYADAVARAAARAFPAVAAAHAEVEALAAGWARLPATRVGAELDQLAVDPAGRLVLLELKDAAAGSAAGVYYAPLQLLQYAWEWHAAWAAVRPGLDALLDARRALGLTPAGAPALREGLRPVVGFGEDGRSVEVRGRFDRVRRVVDRHLPPGVPPVEVWTVDRRGARRVG